jgi:hypothetical protein
MTFLLLLSVIWSYIKDRSERVLYLEELKDKEKVKKDPFDMDLKIDN